MAIDKNICRVMERVSSIEQKAGLVSKFLKVYSELHEVNPFRESVYNLDFFDFITDYEIEEIVLFQKLNATHGRVGIVKKKFGAVIDVSRKAGIDILVRESHTGMYVEVVLVCSY